MWNKASQARIIGATWVNIYGQLGYPDKWYGGLINDIVIVVIGNGDYCSLFWCLFFKNTTYWDWNKSKVGRVLDFKAT